MIVSIDIENFPNLLAVLAELEKQKRAKSFTTTEPETEIYKKKKKKKSLAAATVPEPLGRLRAQAPGKRPVILIDHEFVVKEPPTLVSCTPCLFAAIKKATGSVSIDIENFKNLSAVLMAGG